MLLHVSVDGDMWVSCSNAADLSAMLIDAGTKLHRAEWEAGSARVPAGERASDIGLVGRKCVSMPLPGGLFGFHQVANESVDMMAIQTQARLVIISSQISFLT